MKITRQEVEQVAALARLELQPDEIERITGQLDNILGYAAKLEELDTAGADSPAISCRPAGNGLREDEVSDSLSLEKVLQNAPDHDGQSFVVPRIIT